MGMKGVKGSNGSMGPAGVKVRRLSSKYYMLLYSGKPTD